MKAKRLELSVIKAGILVWLQLALAVLLFLLKECVGLDGNWYIFFTDILVCITPTLLNLCFFKYAFSASDCRQKRNTAWIGIAWLVLLFPVMLFVFDHLPVAAQKWHDGNLAYLMVLLLFTPFLRCAVIDFPLISLWYTVKKK